MADVTVSKRAAEVLLRGLEAARLDPAGFGVRVRLTGGVTQTSFDDEPQQGEQVVTAGSVRIFLDPVLAERENVVIDVTAEHDQIVARTA